MIRATDLRDVTLLVAVCSVLGVVRLALSPDLAWIAPEPRAEDASCGIEGGEEVLVQRISPEEALAVAGRPDVTFVDARAAHAYLEGHVPGALSLPAEDAAGVLEVSSVPIPAENLVITYCDGVACERSEYLGMLLRDRAGCSRVRVLTNGWNGWVAVDGPVEDGP